MENENMGILKIVGIIATVLLVFIAWYSGFLPIIFYLFGLYAVLYFLSIIFKTTAIINTLLGAGMFLFYIWMTIWSLWLLYITLNIMFTESFFLGILLLIIGLPIAETILYGVGMGLGFVLGYPLIWFSDDLEKRFGEKEKFISSEYMDNEDELLEYEDIEKKDNDIETENKEH